MKNTITRKEFITAIEAGIAASADLSADETGRLRGVALTADEVGDNYSSGCPANLAGLTIPDKIQPDYVVKFAHAYDDALFNLGVKPFGRKRIAA